ncbi:MAG: hypothetical protein H6709_04755 [Kofleriaceae bacterium]|nr:hypothetical protein [Myxococcales bacterium]MCB9561184.1 hypothetical protein [Kofleriaceae bacterium]MCB9571380.1 hypothetical protein [Kofleriaceae bacterium]
MLTARHRLGRSLAAALVAAGAAATLAVACSSPATRGARLPKAGEIEDDGSGLLARASVKLLSSTDDGGFEPEPQRTDTYGYGYGYDYSYAGFTYGGFGGDGYGGGAYGGSMYANYQMPYTGYAAPSAPAYTINYTTAAEGGTIEGTVRWPKPPRHDATLAIAGCGAVDNQSLRLGARNTVEGAVVYLENIKSGRQWVLGYKQLAVGGVVEERDCALWPRVQVHAPAPGQLQLVNTEELPVTLVAERPGDPAFARSEQRLNSGARRWVPVPSAGVTRIADVDGQRAPAWVVTQDHPYYTLTDAQGHFRLDEIVPGDYTLVAWHPPVVTGVKDGVVQYGAPVVVKKKVTVKKTASTRVTLDLE